MTLIRVTILFLSVWHVHAGGIIDLDLGVYPEFPFCINRPCKNGATCVSLQNGFRCVCPEGLFGELCDEVPGNCGSSPCLNGGNCTDTVFCEDDPSDGCEDFLNGFKCDCADGYAGIACDTNLRCGRLGRICASDANCRRGRCRCPEGTHGNPLFCCSPTDNHYCEMTADPHLRTFGKARGGLFWPCKYRLVQFTTSLSDQFPEEFKCFFELYGFNWLTDSGRYFTRGIRLVFRLFNGTDFLGSANILKIDINSFFEGFSIGETFVLWGRLRILDLNNVTVECEFDPVNNIAHIFARDCGVDIKFRPFNANDEPGPQSRIPGIVITASRDDTDSVTGPEQRFPDSLCGHPVEESQNKTLLTDCPFSFGDPDVAVLYAALQQGLPQYPIISDSYCDDTIQTFDECANDELRKGGVRACLPILKKKRVIKCLQSDNVLRAFDKCLEAYCKCDDALFQTLLQDFDAARSFWNGQNNPENARRCRRFPGEVISRYEQNCAE